MIVIILTCHQDFVIISSTSPLCQLLYDINFSHYQHDILYYCQITWPWSNTVSYSVQTLPTLHEVHNQEILFLFLGFVYTSTRNNVLLRYCLFIVHPLRWFSLSHVWSAHWRKCQYDVVLIVIFFELLATTFYFRSTWSQVMNNPSPSKQRKRTGNQINHDKILQELLLIMFLYVLSNFLSVSHV